eukprot:scaffold281874_cov24-Tisochrysis_lutea.AAC.2
MSKCDASPGRRGPYPDGANRYSPRPNVPSSTRALSCTSGTPPPTPTFCSWRSDSSPCVTW